MENVGLIACPRAAAKAIGAPPYLPEVIKGIVRYVLAREARLAAEAARDRARAQTRAAIAAIEAFEREALRRHERFMATVELLRTSRDAGERLRLAEALLNI